MFINSAFFLVLMRNYNELIMKGALETNPFQEKVLSDLDFVFNEIHLPRSKLPFFGKFLGGSTSSIKKQGAYIYGDVGSGKTMLMDLFFNSSSISAKHRVHYNQFMNEIHKGTKLQKFSLKIVHRSAQIERELN